MGEGLNEIIYKSNPTILKYAGQTLNSYYKSHIVNIIDAILS